MHELGRPGQIELLLFDLLQRFQHGAEVDRLQEPQILCSGHIQVVEHRRGLLIATKNSVAVPSIDAFSVVEKIIK